MPKMSFRRFRGSRNQTNFGGRKRRRTYVESSDSSDEDFVLDEEEEDDGNDSTTEDEVNDSDEEEEAESTESEDSDEDSVILKSRKKSKSRSNNNRGWGRHGTSKKKPRNQSTKRVEISSSDDEDFDPNYMSSTTDEEECVDDDNEGDEEFAKSRQKRKQGRKPRSSGTQKSRKRKKAPVSKKPSKSKKMGPTKNQRETGRVSQRSTKSKVGEGTESDEDFAIFPKQQVKRQRTSFQSGETRSRTSRKRKLYNTYSNSSCSDSDYIISEDDDELTYHPHRLDIVCHSRNRQEKKYTCSLNSVFNRDDEALRKKGKEKIDKSTVMDLSLAKPVCGVCLSDEGKAVRGKLDCCDHYFCFVCIMEWAKVESRCPMCKQRFNVISKLSKSGKGLRGTSVKIPVRDQVYQPSEEEIMGFLDPYANIVCLECNEPGDDSLLLLCDLCDSPHHTYCVGLGRVVPEGDWYCQACQTSMPTQSNTEEEDANNFVLDFHNEDDGLTIRELVDGIPVGIVGAESINLDLTLSPPFVSATGRARRPSNVRTIRRRMFRRSTPNPSPGLSGTPRASVRQSLLFDSPSQVSSAGARTLSGQRRLQQHIHALRDNLSVQEKASEQFSPDNFVSNSCIGDRDDAVGRPTSTRRGNLDSSKRIENASGNDDIDRAWRLMEESRALAGGNIGINERLTSRRYCQGPFSANSKGNVLDSMHSSRPRSILGTSSSDAQTRIRNWQGGLDTVSMNSRGLSGRSKEETSHRDIGSNMPSTASVLNKRFCPIASEISESPSKRLINPVSYDVQLDESKKRKVEGAKDQVRCMVKAHVKEIIAGKEIDKLVFKEIARSCTHTVLAACGIDHSSHMVQPFERVYCYHTNQVQSSELMPGCCAHCFDLFVKDLAGNMVRQKLGINV